MYGSLSRNPEITLRIVLLEDLAEKDVDHIHCITRLGNQATNELFQSFWRSKSRDIDKTFSSLINRFKTSGLLEDTLVVGEKNWNGPINFRVP